LLGIAQRVANAAPQEPNSNMDSRIPRESNAVSFLSSAQRNGEKPAATIGKKSPGAQYPRFKREDDTLVKIGWSKSDRATYEHRSPRMILERLMSRIVEVGAGGERFTTEQILPLMDESNNELPSYRAYLCLAWLCFAGVLVRHGRQGYTVAVEGEFGQAVQAEWDKLPDR
jgi:hypothetical protein